MTILATDIKLLESERMTDTTDGGGRRTGRVIADGVAGNIFPKVSRTDSVYGRVNLRKVYGLVSTNNVETYAGAHAALIDAPNDPRINVNLFSTGSDFDLRTNARDRIESYVIAGPESRMVLYGRQLAGQQAVTCLQRVEDPLPEVGEVFCLSTETGGVVGNQQYIRAEDVTHEVRTFTDQQGDYSRRVVTVKTGSPLRYEFTGWDQAYRFTSQARASLVRTTTVADAARYFGIKPLTGGVLRDVLELRVDSIFSPIVPTTQREAAVSNAQISGAVQVLPAAPARQTAWRAIGRVFTGNGPGAGQLNTQVLNVGTAIVPGSLQLTEQSLSAFGTEPAGGTIANDDGKGGIPRAGSSGVGNIESGTVDYSTGALTVTTLNGSSVIDNQVVIRYTPAVEVSQTSHTRELPVTLATRGTVQVLTLGPLPAKGTAFLDFRALGKWYRLQDDGTGALKGADAAYGTGTVDPVTGQLVATLGALPDVGSSVIVGWASPSHYSVRAGATADNDTAPRQRFTLAEIPVKPATLTIKLTSGATEYTLTANAAGALTANNGGGITGTINHATGEGELVYSTRVPNAGTALAITYSKETPTNPAQPTSAAGVGQIATMANPTFATVPNVTVQGLRVDVRVAVPPSSGNAGGVVALAAYDDGAGGLFATPQQVQTAGGELWTLAASVRVGAVVYASGAVTIDAAALVPLQRPTYARTLNGGDWVVYSTTSQPLVAGEYKWTARTSSASSATPVAVTLDQVAAPLTLDLTKTLTAAIVPSSVAFNLFGLSYYDRSGALFHSIARDGTGTPAGSIDYKTGRVSLTAYPSGAALGLAVTACLVKLGNYTTAKAAFRTAGSPLRPASTFVQVVAEDGELLTATADQDGTLTGAYARGKVNQAFGIVSIEWGQMVPAGGNESADWYDPANVVGPNVWKPRAVMPETIRYNAVVLSNLPLNADQLGLDPVRLPSDGRVPIFRPADVVLIHHTDKYQLPTPLGAGVTYSVGRADLVDLQLVDANGAAIPANQWTADLVAGTVTLAADINLVGFTTPLYARNRIEELNMLADAQINGQLSLASPLTRDFPAGSLISSALLFGDLFARVTNVFDQFSWTNVWQDSLIGQDTAANFDTINFPLEVKNDGAVTQRWRIHFTTTTAFQIIGQDLGIIGTGTITADCTPVNPLTGKPYFTIRAAGWGAGWAAGNQLRFNTVGATASIWMARTVLPGATLAGDSIDLQLRGDVDA